MIRGLFAFLFVLAVLAGIGVFLSAFIVHQTEQAIVLRFGKIEREISDKPGLYWRVPVMDEVVYFDKRILDLDIEPQEVITSDQKRLVVDAFARFRITDPLTFYQRVRTEERARNRLGTFLEAALRRVLGGATFQDLVRDKRETLMEAINGQVNTEADDLGVRVIDVRIRRADLPEANSEAIYRRMQTERQQEAAEFRAEGSAAANRIRATADREATIIKAEATKKSEQIRGDGDATRNRIFSEAFGRDADFFKFYRRMQAWEKGLAGNADANSRMVLSPNSGPFKEFFQTEDTPSAPAN
ncbi:MAG: protease modulator HflC, partial [Pseudomonadota bacterium]